LTVLPEVSKPWA